MFKGLYQRVISLYFSILEADIYISYFYIASTIIISNTKKIVCMGLRCCFIRLYNLVFKSFFRKPLQQQVSS